MCYFAAEILANAEHHFGGEEFHHHFSGPDGRHDSFFQKGRITQDREKLTRWKKYFYLREGEEAI